MESDLLDSEFARDNFDAQAHVESRFEQNTHMQMKERYMQLLKQKKVATESMRRNVATNYSVFVSTSREIGNLEMDMSNVRNLLIDMSGTIKELSHAETIDFTRTPVTDPVALAMEHADVDFQSKNAIAKTLKQCEPAFRWLVRAPRQLEVLVAQRRFDDAVALIEHVNTLLKQDRILEQVYAGTPARAGVARGTEALLQQLTHQLQSPVLGREDTRTTISLMQRLGWTERAKHRFLRTRSEQISVATRKLVFQGDVGQYIDDVAQCVFSAILSTCDDFCHSFDDPAMMSAFVVWAMHELERFATVFARHVFGTDNFELMSDCIAIVRLHCDVLEDRGMFVSFHIDALFHEHLAAVITAAYAPMAAALRRALDAETWQSTRRWVYDMASPRQTLPEATEGDGGDGADKELLRAASARTKTSMQLTSSAKQLYALVQRFLEGTTMIITYELSPVIARVYERIFALYFDELDAAVPQLNERQLLAAIGNARCLVSDLVPQVLRAYQARLGDIPLRDLHTMAEGAEERYAALVTAALAQSPGLSKQVRPPSRASVTARAPPNKPPKAPSSVGSRAARRKKRCSQSRFRNQSTTS